MSSSRRRAVLALASASLLAGFLPVTGAMAAPAPAPSDPPAPPAVELPPPAPAGPLSGVLVSEVASGGPGGGSENFIEITNYGPEPADISGWKIFRCGQTGDGYGPQAVVPDGTVLAPGAQFTAVREGGGLDDGTADATYDTSLHSFGFGAFLQNAEGQLIDRVGFYHESVDSDCKNPVSLQNQASWAHGQSHQRAALTGDVTKDWIVAERTPGAANATEPQSITAPGDIVISEYAPGGPAGYNDDFIELANAGDEPVDISGWKVWRCGDNAQTYAQSNGLPAGTVLEPGQTFTLASNASPTPADLRYATSVHWINSGAMVLTAEDMIVDRMSIYSNRVSPCTDGNAKVMDLSVVDGESYQRVSRTGDNATDFQAAKRTPGEWLAADQLEPVEIADSAFAGSVQITEIIGSGPAGGNDEFVEITNLGDAPVDLTGWSLHRCEGTGRRSAEPQVADLGGTLAPGATYVAAQSSASAEVLAVAQATYSVGLNQTDGYGAMVVDADGARVDGVSVYDTIPLDHCGRGLTLQNNTKSDLGISYQRARSTGGSYDDFIKADRSPGQYVAHTWRDEATPRDGQLDPVTVERSYRPGTPIVERDGEEAEEDGSFVTQVRTEHAGDAQLDVSFRSATPINIDRDATRIWSGTTATVPPASLAIEGEQLLGADASLISEGGTGAYPFQRYEITMADVPEEGAEVVWTGITQPRNEIQLYGWDAEQGSWLAIAAGQPSADGELTLVGRVTSAMFTEGVVNVLVLDGPRTTGGLFDEVAVTDGAFADPGEYDLAINHMTDTQFYSEGFVSVFTDMVAWVVANAQGRNIAYNSLTGDIIENWIGGNSDPLRARREFSDAKKIVNLLNEAGVPNGVLPGNHDNFWGRNNDMYNEYFGPEMFADKPWWGNSWQPGDNSAHYDYFVHDGTKFLIVNLPYRPSEAQMEWASSVAQANPSFNVVLATHSYLYTDGTVEDVDRRYTALGRQIWERIVAPNDNVFLVLGGHYHGVATNYADPVTGERVDATQLNDSTVVIDNVGASGRRVVEMLADYQGYRSTQPNPRADVHDRDTGFQRLLQLDLDAGLMAVNAYSPTLDSFEAWKYDEPDFRGANARYGPEDDEFVVQLSLQRPTSFATQAWTVQGTASEAATVRVASGEVAEHEWAAEDEGLNWYAVISAAAPVAEESAEDAQGRAAEGALLEELLQQQSIERAETEPYPAGMVQRPAPEASATQEPSDAEPTAEPAAPTAEPSEGEPTAEPTEAEPTEGEPTAEPTTAPSEPEPTPEPSAEPGLRALVEPAAVSGAMVATFPRMIGTESRPGEPTDPGDPGDPEPPVDPGPGGPGTPGGPGNPPAGPGAPGTPGGSDPAPGGADRPSRDAADRPAAAGNLPDAGSDIGLLLLLAGAAATVAGWAIWRRRRA
ncbi:hypothetical protein EHW97_11170 [Aeromicrobium camelliae]|uniref:LPXTG cell wall anchor domain-containing protein n=1 Tax=Aeromicrobium camelliae TaxID=1538144 RepID=A0A3N6WMX4_9ACTN|nr:lamin tail domain-containing protein [Aeromicrobium camelliae]RQN02988.1 hypothetical protein EHW97_11170 [Aeromicrobium camelliae]